jgi:hypothetical protein
MNGFPIWKPARNSILANWDASKIPRGSENQKLYYKKLRTSCRGFLAKTAVRQYVFCRDFYECVECGSQTNLQVDHVISVYACSLGKIPVSQLNTLENLRTLCGKCNASKTP